MSHRNAGIYTIPRDVVFEILDGEAVALNLSTGVYFSLNQTAARAFSLFEKPRSLREVRNLLLPEFAVEPERLEQDLEALVRTLCERGLLAPSPPEGEP